jgi:hypothetical protein|tara:strand:+ start:123 stop:335 length:213 start_codon:yes stop_codon:yes gene_type:complete
MKTIWQIEKGDYVKVKLYEYHGLEERQGIVLSDKFDDENTMFPCVYVYIFGLNESQRCFPHQLEVLSSAS